MAERTRKGGLLTRGVIVARCVVHSQYLRDNAWLFKRPFEAKAGRDNVAPSLREPVKSTSMGATGTDLRGSRQRGGRSGGERGLLAPRSSRPRAPILAPRQMASRIRGGQTLESGRAWRRRAWTIAGAQGPRWVTGSSAPVPPWEASWTRAVAEPGWPSGAQDLAPMLAPILSRPARITPGACRYGDPMRDPSFRMREPHGWFHSGANSREF